MTIKRKSVLKTNYSPLSSDEGLFAKWRRRTDTVLKEDIERIDKTTVSLQEAISNTPGLTRAEIKNRQRMIRRAGNAEKLKRILR